MELRGNRRVALLITAAALVVLLIIIGRLLGVGTVVHQFNRLISAEPKEATVNSNPPTSASEQFDQTMLDELLRAYVNDDGWVDYASLRRERDKLDSYLARVASKSLAFWIDAYNAFTLSDALDGVYGKARSVQAVSGFFDRAPSS